MKMQGKTVIRNLESRSHCGPAVPSISPHPTARHRYETARARWTFLLEGNVLRVLAFSDQPHSRVHSICDVGAVAFPRGSPAADCGHETSGCSPTSGHRLFSPGVRTTGHLSQKGRRVVRRRAFHVGHEVP